MRRGFVAIVAVVAAFFAAQPAPAASWAQPQIKVVVANGLMGPSVSNVRAKQNITRGDGRPELGARDVLLGAEVLDARPHEAVRDDDLDLRLRPTRGERGLRCEKRGEHGDDSDEAPAHAAPIVGPRGAL